MATQRQWKPGELGEKTFGGTTPKQAQALFEHGYSADEIRELRKDADKFNAVLRQIEAGTHEWSQVKPIDDINSYITEIGGKYKKKHDGETLRWPSTAVDKSTDYVLFQFGKYNPPFSTDVDALRKQRDVEIERLKEVYGDGFKGLGDSRLAEFLVEQQNITATRQLYNASNEYIQYKGTTIMLPMPQDLSNEINQQWQGKQFTATGRAAVAALAAGQFSYASEVVKNIAGNATALQTALNTAVLNSIPGVGGNLDFNDVSGASRGIVINPNAELLYDSPEMREIGMIFKLVPRNAEESLVIKRICNFFRQSSMPRWGGLNQQGGELADGEKVDIVNGETPTEVGEGSTKAERKSQIDLGSRDNWIQVPDLCKFQFMTGHSENPYINKFKPCAISGVEVNYTPDGTYASHKDGAPVAIELRLNFMETKLIFADEVTTDGTVSY